MDNQLCFIYVTEGAGDNKEPIISQSSVFHYGCFLRRYADVNEKLYNDEVLMIVGCILRGASLYSNSRLC